MKRNCTIVVLLLAIIMSFVSCSGPRSPTVDELIALEKFAILEADATIVGRIVESEPGFWELTGGEYESEDGKLTSYERYPSGDKEIVDCAGIIDGKSYTLYTEQNKDSAELLLCKLNNVILIL